MSDIGRKNISEQVENKVTPDSQKSMMEEAQQKASGKVDDVQSSMQPGDSKSTTQKLSDTARSGGQSTEESGKGIVESMEDAATNAKDTVSRALGGSGGSGAWNQNGEAGGEMGNVIMAVSEGVEKF